MQPQAGKHFNWDERLRASSWFLGWRKLSLSRCIISSAWVNASQGWAGCREKLLVANPSILYVPLPDLKWKFSSCFHDVQYDSSTLVLQNNHIAATSILTVCGGFINCSNATDMLERSFLHSCATKTVVQLNDSSGYWLMKLCDLKQCTLGSLLAAASKLKWYILTSDLKLKCLATILNLGHGASQHSCKTKMVHYNFAMSTEKSITVSMIHDLLSM